MVYNNLIFLDKCEKLKEVVDNVGRSTYFQLICNPLSIRKKLDCISFLFCQKHVMDKIWIDITVIF